MKNPNIFVKVSVKRVQNVLPILPNSDSCKLLRTSSWCLVLNFLQEVVMVFELFGCTFGTSRGEIFGQIFYKQGLGLTEVPTDMPGNMSEVYLDSNSITHLAIGVFSKRQRGRYMC